jgi:two-component system CheB/CheR fusion protein
VNIKTIVAIGGSAGSLEPIKNILSNTYRHNVPYIVLNHLPIGVQSQLPTILKRYSNLEIIEAANNAPIQQDKVYVLPSGMYMTIEDKKLKLNKRESKANWAFDTFFQSFANEYKTKAIAVMLSGCGSDGARGAATIKSFGGKVIVQAPLSCEFPFMVENIINQGFADKIAKVEDIPTIIQEYVKEIISK